MTSENKEKLNRLFDEYKEEIYINIFDNFAENLLRECGAIVFSEMRQEFYDMFGVNLYNCVNKKYCIENDVVFNADKTILIKYSLEKSGGAYTIPASVKTIADNAFENNASLWKIEIPDSVERLGNGVFRNSSHLSEIVWGAVKSGGSNVFKDCKKLKTVYVKDVNLLWEYRCDNYGSPFINGAKMMVNGKEFDGTLIIPKEADAGTGLRAFQGCTSIKDIVFEENNAYVKGVLQHIVDHGY